MKIETLPQENHQVRLVVELETEQLQAGKRRAARRISNRAKIPGFRPGKAPYDIVLRFAGEQAVTEEAVELLVDEVYPKVLEEAGIKPVAPGSLEQVESLEPPKFIFLVPLEPVVDLGDYRSVRLSYAWQAPGEKELEAALQDMRQVYSTTETVERPAQAGDFVMVDILGRDAKSAEGEPPLVERPGAAIFIRPEEKDADWPFKGFAQKLIGLKSGGSAEISHKYGKDFDDDSLAGKTVKYHITMKVVRGVTLPELDDEFAKTVGAFADLSALRDTLRASLEQRSRRDYDDEYCTNVMNKMREKASIKYPPVVLENQVEHSIADLKERLSSQGMELDTYLKARHLEKDKFVEEEIKPAATRRLERALLMEEFVRTEKIEVNDEQLNSSMQQTWLELQSNREFQKSINSKSTSKQVMNAVAMESASRALTSQAMARLKEIATGQAVGKKTDGGTGTARTKKAAPGKTAAGAGKGATGKPAARPRSKSVEPSSGKKQAVEKKSTPVE